MKIHKDHSYHLKIALHCIITEITIIYYITQQNKGRVKQVINKLRIKRRIISA